MMRRLIALGLCSLSLAACAGKYEGHRGPLVDALANVTTRPGMLQPMPSFHQHEGSSGVMPHASPAVEPARVIDVWIYPHKNAHGDVIAGHWVSLLYKDTTFADLPGGRARVPVSPRLEDAKDEAPCCPDPQQPPPQTEHVPAKPSSPSPQPHGQVSDLMQKMEKARQRWLSQHHSVLKSPPENQGER